jgi:hypothetical protein
MFEPSVSAIRVSKHTSARFHGDRRSFVGPLQVGHFGLASRKDFKTGRGL